MFGGGPVIVTNLSFPLPPPRSRTGFHDLDVTRRHRTDLVDLATSFTDDAADKVVGDKDLLGLATGGS